MGLLSTGSTLYHAEVLRGDDFKLPKSPPTTPFVAPLPIMPTLGPPAAPLNPAPTINANVQHGEAPRANHQLWAQYPPQEFYELHVTETPHFFHPELPASLAWTFNNITPGPTIYGTYGQPVLVRYHNDLPANHVGFGIPQVSVHLHNAHTASESDGYPGDFYNTGFFKDHH